MTATRDYLTESSQLFADDDLCPICRARLTVEDSCDECGWTKTDDVDIEDAIRTVSEIHGQPGRVITGGRLWTSDSRRPDPVRRSDDPFALIPGCGEDDEECLTCPPGMPCCCTADSSDLAHDLAGEW